MTQVLLVDDDEAIRETIRLALEDGGYQVQEASDGLAALEKLREATTGMVVLLDLMMPKLDGAGVLGAVAGDRRLAKRHAFILTTATHQTQTLAFVNLLTDLAVPILRKPFELDDLLAIVQRAAQRL